MNSGVTQAAVAQALAGTEVSRGRMIKKLVCPGRLVTLTLPPCAVVTACTMARPSPVLVEGDEHRLHQVLANLMSNAAKHTPQGTTVTVSLTTSEAPPAVQVSVTDSGPGIPEELQPALFERFVRGDTARSNAGTSTGLGLAIVQAVTTAHGGSVSVTSRPGHTSFVITLPRLTSVPTGA